MATDGITETLGDRIKQARLAKRLKQSELADRIHTVQCMVSDWELDKRIPSDAMIERIASVTGRSVEYFTEALQQLH